MRKLLLLLLVPLLLLSACGEDWEGNGDVVDKNHYDSNDWYQPPISMPGTRSCSGGYNNQPLICNESPGVYIPGMWQHDPEQWSIVVEDENGKEHEKYVDENTYLSCDVGSRYVTGYCEQQPSSY